MHLKQTGYCFGVLLVHTVTTITLPPVASVYSPPLNSHLSPLDNDRGGGFTPEGLPRLSPRGGRERPRRGGESGPLPYFHNLEVGDRQRTETSGLTPEHTATSADKGSGSRNEPERSDGRNKDCGKGMIERVTPGSFYITGPFQSTWHAGHQADPAAADQGGREGVGGQERVGGRELSGYEASWQKLQPVVHCGDNAMTLTVRRRRAVQLQLGRVKESSVPFSQLPAQCGYSVHSTWRDFSLTAPYGACHVTQEDGGYALPLLWRGTPVKMSCPAPQMQPEAAGPYALCCSLHGMTVKVKGLHSTEELRVNVRGKWNPLGELAEVCGYTVDRRDADIILAAPFMTCGVTVKDGKYTLSLQVGEKTFTLACPVSPPEELSLTHQPVVNSPHLTRGPAGHLPESPLAFPWVPPFYLAPPYHPHPTYPLKYSSPDGHAADNPAAPSSATPDPTLSPQPPPAADPWTDDQNYFPQPIPARESDKHFGVHSSLLSTDDDDNENSGRVNPDPPETPVLGVSERYSATRSLRSDTGLLIQGDSPTPLQPPSHAFNPYYHYYHHPKIPLPAAPKDSDPGPEFSGELTSTNPNNPENRAFPLNVQRPEALRTINARQFLQAAPHSYTLPTKASALEAPPHPPQPYPYRSYYPPHIAKVEARKMAPLNPDAAAKNNLSDHQNSKSNAFIHPLPCSSSGYNLNMNTDAELDDGRRLSAPADQPSLTYPPRPDAVAAPPTDQPSFPTPPPYHNLPYPYYYHPYLYYRMYYGPGGSPSADNRPSQTSSSDAIENLPPASFAPPHRPSYPNHQSTTPPAKSTNDIRYHPLYPYYYNFHYNTQQHPSDAFGRPAGEKAERLDSEMTDKLKATPSTPSPTGLGTEFDCSVFLGCCSYPVKSCTKGQHLILALPDSVLEPTVPPPAHPSQRSNGSCTLYKLTSDRDLYAVPLEGCGVIQHVFGETVVHLLEVHGIHSLQRGHSSELVNSPVRLMVACSASPGSPGEVTLHVMAQPPPARSPPAAVTVLLRIAKDESFTGFHPEAHLPLSLLRGRPVYVEVSLLNPPRPGLVLLVHSCLAYTRAPYASWMLVYDGCLDRSYSDRLLPPHHELHHIRRFIVSGFLSLNSQSLSYAAEGGHAHPQDPEIYFLCLTEVCSASHGDCTVGCVNGKLHSGNPIK